MKRKLLLFLGFALMAGGMLLFAATQWLGDLGQKQCRETVQRMEALLPESKAGIPGLYSNTDMPVLSLKDKDYSALLSVPSQGVKLPVVHRWKDRNLLTAPCRFSGSVYDGTLVIGGTDRPGQLDFCKRLDIGDEIRITDMAGLEFRFTVTRVERTSDPTAEKLMKEEYDLTVYVKDSYSLEYILVRCNGLASG